MVRCPFSLSRLIQATNTGQVVYKAEKQACQAFPDPHADDLKAGREEEFPDPLATRFPGTASPANWARSTDHRSALVPGRRARI